MNSSKIDRSWVPKLVVWLKQIEELNYSWTLTGSHNAKLSATGLYCKLATIYQNFHQFNKQKLKQEIDRFKTDQGYFKDNKDFRYNIAECRQAMAGLLNLGFQLEPFQVMEPFYPNPNKLYFMSDQDWNRPYSTGAQLSHYLFFCHQLQETGRIDQVLKQIQKYEHPDGWYHQRPGGPHGYNRQIVNGIMKVMTGLDVLDHQLPIDQKKCILDHLLKTNPLNGGCDIYDYVYVIVRCLDQSDYRKTECQQKLMSVYNLILKHQMSDGGFSYDLKHCRTEIYGTKIASPGKRGDIHGTTLFSMALAMIDQACELNLGLCLAIS